MMDKLSYASYLTLYLQQLQFDFLKEFFFHPHRIFLTLFSCFLISTLLMCRVKKFSFFASLCLSLLLWGSLTFFVIFQSQQTKMAILKEEVSFLTGPSFYFAGESLEDELLRLRVPTFQEEVFILKESGSFSLALSSNGVKGWVPSSSLQLNRARIEQPNRSFFSLE